jgi:mono/diheme cytochrome c family protein
MKASSLIILALSVAPPAVDAQSILSQRELITRGEYLARAGDCIACHTAADGEPYAGGYGLNTPFGTIYSTNITPDPDTGIGDYTLDDFTRALREGIARDGRRLYPAMPYPFFAKVTHDDIEAIYAFFMHGVQPVKKENRPTDLPWPLSMRSGLAVWNALYLEEGEYIPDPQRSAAWNRGAYLVQGLGHCGACHTPRGIGGQVKSRHEKDGEHFLTGATLDNWYASPLTSTPVTGLQKWTREEIAEFLKTGRVDRLAAFGIMSNVIDQSTQYLTDQDRLAIAEYLKSLPADAEIREQPPQALAPTAATVALRAGDDSLPGARVYLDNCNACHRSDGGGASRTFPKLAQNEIVNAGDPTSLIRLVLHGAAMPSTQTAPSALAMPDFGWRLSDQEVADVLTFIRSSWGNSAAAVDADQVGKLRKAIAESEAASNPQPPISGSYSPAKSR